MFGEVRPWFVNRPCFGGSLRCVSAAGRAARVGEIIITRRPQKTSPTIPSVLSPRQIDCREGILLAVEKLRYEDLEEGMKATIGLFIDAALKLVAEKKLEAYVHPIIPVLNETRKIVRLYNTHLREAVSRRFPKLVWLDHLFDGLLTSDGDSLRPEVSGASINKYQCRPTRIHEKALARSYIHTSPHIHPHTIPHIHNRSTSSNPTSNPTRHLSIP